MEERRQVRETLFPVALLKNCTFSSFINSLIVILIIVGIISIIIVFAVVVINDNIINVIGIIIQSLFLLSLSS